jgi:cytochrome c-type biogenesis protein CcmF
MIAEIGQFALILALCAAVVLAIFPIMGSFLSQPNWMALARPAALLQLLLVSISYIALTSTFITGDYSVSYAANTSNSQLPLMYKISGVWGGHEGSILLWVWVLAIWTGAVAVFSKHMPTVLLSRVLSILGMISIGFLLFVLLTSNPFARLFPVPMDGASLNPLLQDPGMAAHPPLLYMGYVGFSVAFAFAIAALLGGELDSATLRWMRPWTNIAWMFLTLGIALGSYWAYYELGWGGWWFWDPVENASFMPWLVGTALIHSLAASEKRSVFKAWTVLLAVLAFSLSLLGTFIVRSGVLTSVHAFATDPERGMFILWFLAIVVGGSLTLFAARAPKLKSQTGFELVSRESALLLNNILLLVACAAVLLGTMYPLFLDALNMGKISVGPQYFNSVFAPLMLPVVMVVGIGALLNWKKDSLAGRRFILLALIIVSVISGALMATSFDVYKVTAAAAIALALWVAASSLYGVVYRFRNKRNRLSAALHTPAAFWGMTIAHIGMGVFTLGVALTSMFADEQTVRMGVGDTHKLAGYEFRFDSFDEIQGVNYMAARANFAITKNDNPVTLLATEKRIYNVRRDTMTEAGIDGRITRDLFIALGEHLGDGDWSVRLQYKPFIRWIWYGTVFMGLGGLLAAIDRRYRVAAAMQRKASAVGKTHANAS